VFSSSTDSDFVVGHVVEQGNQGISAGSGRSASDQRGFVLARPCAFFPDHGSTSIFNCGTGWSGDSSAARVRAAAIPAAVAGWKNLVGGALPTICSRDKPREFFRTRGLARM